jgi:hypothetical protein
MISQMRWLVAVAACFAALVALHAGSERLFGPLSAGVIAFKWAYGAGFYVFGAVLVGTIARLQPRLAPPLARALTVIVGAVLAGLEVHLHVAAEGVTRLELWTTALLGVALAALTARLAPSSLRRPWMGNHEDKP